jgi:hypothetical protein
MKFNLDPMAESVLLRASRLVPDHARDQFFSAVADRLRHLRWIELTDVRAACAVALRDFGGLDRRRATG